VATHRKPDARKQIAVGSIDAVERGHDISYDDPGHGVGARHERAAEHRFRHRAFRQRRCGLFAYHGCWTEEFAKDHAFVHYDERGKGLSDWNSPTFSVDAFVRDLEAVVDALGFDQFTLIGSSKGGSTAIAYAALHPERVTRLVLYGTYAQGSRVRGERAGIETNEAMIALIQQGWA
jgi:pimeloyl-ACP methyl ester carboxylesterase